MWDRVVMAAAKAILEPILEADFLPCSFGFRPKRSAHQALEVVRTTANQGAIWVLDADISDCFGSLGSMPSSGSWRGGCRTARCSSSSELGFGWG